MASTSLEILIKARDEASSQIRGVESSASHMGTTMSHSTSKASEGAKSMGESFKGAFKAIGAAVGIVGIEQFADKSLEAFDLLEKSENRMGLALKKLHIGSQQEEMVGWAKSFSLQTGINEGNIVDMQSKLVTMGSAFFKAMGPDAGASVDRLTEGMTNLAAATGKSASMLMRSLGPAIVNTPAKAVGLLQKYGVLTREQVGDVQALGTTTRDQLKAMVDAGTVTKGYAAYVNSLSIKQRNLAASQLEINALQAKYSGEAAATATPLERLQNLFNQLELAAGRYISAGLGALLNIGPSVLNWFKEMAVRFAPVIDLFKNAAAQVLPALSDAWNQLKGPLQQFWQAALPILKVLGAVVAIVLLLALKALPFVIKAVAMALVIFIKWETFLSKVLVAAFKFVARVAIASFNALRGPVLAVWHAIQTAWSVARPFFMALFRAIATVTRVEFAVVKAVVVAVWNAVKGAWNGAVGFFSGIWHGIAGGASAAFNAIKGVIIGAINWVIDRINSLQIHIHLDPPGPGSINFDYNGPGIPHLAAGGIVRRPTYALIGEAGPEAVIPLDRATGGSGGVIHLGRRHFTDESDFEVRFSGTR